MYDLRALIALPFLIFSVATSAVEKSSLKSSVKSSVRKPPSKIDIRVRLARQLTTVDVSGQSLKVGKLSASVPTTSAPSTTIQKAKIRRLKSGVWLVKFHGSKTWQPIESDRLTVSGETLRLGVNPVPFDLELVRGAKNTVDVISRIDLDEYLRGVVPSEMPASWPIEALKAQAVAARSFAMSMAIERRKRSFDVDSTVFDQVYKFESEVRDHPEWGEKINRAIRETRDEILVDSKKKVLRAFYSADCGCQSEDPKFVWGKHEAFESVKDPNCGKRPASTWKLSLQRKEVRQKLLAALDLPEDTNFRTLQVGGRTPSGRVAEVVADVEVDGKAKNMELNSQQFREIFGFEKIRSTDFSLKWSANELQINGSGIGHGVGLCQKGAHALADDGKTYQEILKIYYPRAKLITPKRA